MCGGVEEWHNWTEVTLTQDDDKHQLLTNELYHVPVMPRSLSQHMTKVRCQSFSPSSPRLKMPIMGMEMFAADQHITRDHYIMYRALCSNCL